jgi:pentose-5-phosphate-3-epimerase
LKKVIIKKQLPDIDILLLKEIAYLIASNPGFKGKNIDMSKITKISQVFKLCSGKDPGIKDINKLLILFRLVK